MLNNDNKYLFVLQQYRYSPYDGKEVFFKTHLYAYDQDLMAEIDETIDLEGYKEELLARIIHDFDPSTDRVDISRVDHVVVANPPKASI